MEQRFDLEVSADRPILRLDYLFSGCTALIDTGALFPVWTFLAKSQRYELCSERCRKAQALQNKREFDERARENNYDLLYKNECQNWRNKINKAKKTDGFPDERLEEMKNAFDTFKKEALHRKKLIHTGESNAKEFMDWIYLQDNIIAEFIIY